MHEHWFHANVPAPNDLQYTIVLRFGIEAHWQFIHPLSIQVLVSTELVTAAKLPGVMADVSIDYRRGFLVRFVASLHCTRRKEVDTLKLPLAGVGVDVKV